MDFTDVDRTTIGRRASEFVRATEAADPDLAVNDFAALNSDEGRDRFVAVLGRLASTKYVSASETLIANQGDQAEGMLHGVTGGAGLGHYILRAFHQSICTNEKLSADLGEELEKLQKAGVKITTPTAAGICGGAAATVTVLVAGSLSGVLAAVLAPFAGGVTLLILVCGIKGFCEWLSEPAAGV
jgi:hypothetical protein